MLESNIYIVIYIALWAASFFYYLKKKRVFGAGNFILATYLTYAIVSFLLYNNEYYQWVEVDKELTLFPFVYLFVIMLVVLRPVLKYDETCDIQQPSSILINILSLTFVISSILVLPFLLSNLMDGLTLMLISGDGAEELYADSHEGLIEENKSLAYNLIHTVYSLFSDFGVLLFFTYSIRPKANKLLLIGMAIGIFIGMVEPLSRGLRTDLVMKFLTILATYFLFRYHLPHKMNLVFKYAGITLAAFVALFIVVINTSRFSDRPYDSSYQLLNYTGMANLNFDRYGLDAGGTRNGDRTFNYFKKWLRFSGVPADTYDTRAKYSHLKMDDSVFSTYVGDFTLDFGPVGAALLLCSSTLLFTLLTRHQRKRKKIPFHKLIAVFFVMAVCAQGGMYLFYYSNFRNYNIVYLALFYLIFRFDYFLRFNTVKSMKSEASCKHV